MQNFRIALRKNQFIELKKILLHAISFRTKLQELHYAELFLLYQAMRKYLVKVERMENEYRPNTNKLRKLSFVPHEANILIKVILWTRNSCSDYSKITISEFLEQCDRQSDEYYDFMVGKFYRNENQLDMVENVKSGKFRWEAGQ